MHIHFLGIGGTAIGPLALIAHQAGYRVSGSDKQDSQYLSYLKEKGLTSIYVGNNDNSIKGLHQEDPIGWIVTSSAVSIENPDHPELVFARENNIKVTKRDDFLNKILEDSGKKLIAVAGTHGKTTTTAMAIWLFKQLGIPVSYSVGAKIPFGEMGHFDHESEYFVYECDEFDRNFLSFHPHLSLITGIDYDHHEIFPTREDYQSAFRQFLNQSEHSIVWQSDAESSKMLIDQTYTTIDDGESILNTLSIAGGVNRRNAWQAITAANLLTGKSAAELIGHMESFPGLSRRFEKISDNLYTDYAHTPPKIAGCLQMAKEQSENVVVVYEPLTNRRQHYIKDDYKDLFTGVKKLYWVPSYLAREDSAQHVLTPAELIQNMANKEIAEPAQLNEALKHRIKSHTDAGDLVVCLSGGGGHSLDEWLRKNFN